MIKASRGPSRRTDAGEAFVPDPRTAGRANAADAEFFAEEFLASATSGENVEQDASDEVTPEEYGGPFLEETLADLDDDLVDTLPEPPTLKAP